MLDDKNTKVEDLAREAAQLENDGAKFMNPGEKRKRGRPAGSTKKKTEAGPTAGPQPPQEPQGMPTKDMVKPYIQLLSSTMGKVLDDSKAEMSEVELEAITNSTAAMCDKYLPIIAGQYAIELMWFTTVMVYGARVYVIRSEKIAERRERERREPYVNGAAGQSRPSGPQHAGPRPIPTIPTNPNQSPII